MNRYAFTNKNLFPPVLPTSVPAFIADGNFKIFFRKSVANFANIINQQGNYDKFNQIHVAVNALETNKNSIDLVANKTGYICLPLSTKSLDDKDITTEPGNVYKVFGQDPKTAYCAVLKGLGHSFPKEDKLYKVQIRLGYWTDASGGIKIPKTMAEMREMERDSKTTSEWSAVTMIKPISQPDFGIHKFKAIGEFEEGEENLNTIGTANFDYVGYYNTVYDSFEEQGYKTFSGDERLTEYSFKLYDSSGSKLLSDSGPINLTEHERKNISYTFNYLTQDQQTYFVDMTIKTENGYEETKRYPIKADYIILEMSNAMVRVTEERSYARMKLEIQAKQVVLEPTIKPGETEIISKLEFVKDVDDPMYSEMPEFEQDKIVSTHAMIEGKAKASKSFYLSCPRDIWILESKLAGIAPFDTREEAMEKPYILIENVYAGEENVPYLTKVRLISYKKVVPGLGATTKIVVDQATGIKSLEAVNNDKNIYVIEAVKTSYRRERGEDIPILEQTVKKENVTRKKITWTENLPQSAPIEDRTPTELSMESRWTFKDITTEDVVYPMKEDGSRLQTPKEADPQLINTTKKAFVINEPKPINPCQEYYLFLSNYMGGLGMEILETKKYLPNPYNPI